MAVRVRENRSGRRMCVCFTLRHFPPVTFRTKWQTAKWVCPVSQFPHLWKGDDNSPGVTWADPCQCLDQSLAGWAPCKLIIQVPCVTRPISQGRGSGGPGWSLLETDNRFYQKGVCQRWVSCWDNTGPRAGLGPRDVGGSATLLSSHPCVGLGWGWD